MSEEEKKEEMEGQKGEEEVEGFEILAEWTIRRLRPLEPSSKEDHAEDVKRWVLYSLGLDKLSQDIFLYLEKARRTTTTEVSSKFGMSPNTARKYLDDLHTIGFVDYIGREYNLTYDSLSRAIELMFIPRITDALRTIARGASISGHPLRPTLGVEDAHTVISDIPQLIISKKDLEESEAPVSFSDISHLIFEDDVDIDTFEKFVAEISDCSVVEIPRQLPKLRALKKCSDCSEIRNRG